MKRDLRSASGEYLPHTGEAATDRVLHNFLQWDAQPIKPPVRNNSLSIECGLFLLKIIVRVMNDDAA